MPRVFGLDPTRILSAAEKWRDNCLLNDGSVFSDEYLWTSANLNQFKEFYVDRPNPGKGDFMEKFEAQLAEAPAEAKKLAAEIYWFYCLFPWRSPSRAKKVADVRKIWAWSGDSLPEGHPMLESFDLGLGSCGTAYNTRKWQELVYVWQFVSDFKKLDHDTASALVADPWAFSVWLDGCESIGNRQMRHIVRYLLFPDIFERISSGRHKRQIIAKLEHLVPQAPESPVPEGAGPQTERDWKVYQIRQALDAGRDGEPMDFYETKDVAVQWQEHGLLADEDEALMDPVRTAEILALLEANRDLLWKRFRATAGDFESFANPGQILRNRELDYKHEILRKAQSALDPDPFEAKLAPEATSRLLSEFQKADVNLVNFRSWKSTFGKNSEVISRVLHACHDFANGEVSMNQFFEAFHADKLKPKWDALSFVLWLLNPGRFFPIKISYYRDLSDELAMGLKRRQPPTPLRFQEIMSFGEAFRQFLEPEHPKDWIDVQSFIWICCFPCYAPPFDTIFRSDEADAILDSFAEVLQQLEQSPGYKPDLLALTLPSSSGPSIALNYADWALFSYQRKGVDAFVWMALPADIPVEEHWHSAEPFHKETEAGQTRLSRLSEEEFRKRKDVWKALLDNIPAVVARFEHHRASQYARFRVPALYDLISDEAERRRILADGLPYAPISVREDPAPYGKQNHWWLNANPKIWDFANLPIGGAQTYTARNQKGNKRQKYKYFEQVRPGDVVVGYLTSPAKQVVSLCEITKGMAETDGEGFEFRKTEELSRPLGLEDLRAMPELKTCEPLLSNQGSLFRVTESEFEFLRSVIDEEADLAGKASPYSREDALDSLFMPDAEFDRITALLQRKKNIILQGPPGVGKTFIARRLAYALMREKDESRAPMIQFHQSYAYEDFIQGYRPDRNGGFILKSGIFHTLCRRAQRDRDRPWFLIIDEINRGNLSKIFGELMMLMEADKRGPEFSLQLTYSETPEDTFYIPENLHLIGTMNTADRSLAMVDYALRRRFAFITLEPQFGSKKFRSFLADRGVDQVVIDHLCGRFEALNARILEDSRNLGWGYRIGHSFFCPSDGELASTDWYELVIESEIEPLLREYWVDDEARVKSELEKLQL